MLIGLDLDNTIIDYDAAFLSVGLALGLLPIGFTGSKRVIRDTLRAGPGGDLDWQVLQAEVYGPAIGAARPADGLEDFLGTCRDRGVQLAIVSHKTEFAAARPQGSNLHEAAIGWLDRSGILENFVPADSVFFETSRDRKLGRIGALGCKYFVDDLEEVLGDPGFPKATAGLLYDPEGGASAEGDFRRFASWKAITAFVFGHETRRAAG